MGIFRRGAGDNDQQQEAQQQEARQGDCPVPVLLVLDDLIGVLDLVAGHRGTRARAAAERAEQLRADGARLVDVAAAMNAAGTPTPGGGARWWPSHVSRLLATQDARTAQAAAAALPAEAPA